MIYVSYGRIKIYSDAKEITAQNVVDEVNKAYCIHIRTPTHCHRGKASIPIKKGEEIPRLLLFLVFLCYANAKVNKKIDIISKIWYNIRVKSRQA